MEMRRRALISLFMLVYISTLQVESAPLACKVSTLNTCVGYLYFVSPQEQTAEQVADMLSVSPMDVGRTYGEKPVYVINVTCRCEPDSNQFLAKTDYIVRVDDSWNSISLAFDGLISADYGTVLYPPLKLELKIQCGCQNDVGVMTYRVVSGDTVYGLATRFNTSWNRIVKLNGLVNESEIGVDQILFLPMDYPENLISQQIGSTTFRVIGLDSEKPVVFTYDDILEATDNLHKSRKIGEGSYGSVYLGKLMDKMVAIKQMRDTKSKEFLAELKILCKVHHSNLVELIGYSAGGEHLFLVYEYAENGALSECLHDPSSKGHKPLSWTERVQIALDAARGLEYIHEHTKPIYAHRDVKTSNILLDSDLRAKIADFGLVKLLEHSLENQAATTKVVGTFGYLAPEYVRDGHVSTKNDVYAFGVVLMELISGQPALCRSTKSNVGEWKSLISFVTSIFKESDITTNLKSLVDKSLLQYPEDLVLKMAILSTSCVEENPDLRPNMLDVVFALSQMLQLSSEWETAQTDHIPDFDVLYECR
ncbi:lysM domain receptor-like kinase 3 isoform X2 [Cryptomeria japonica]|uniref:lysM domain receptor-like kinase 3 isoform X2 n=1 Tax=Cryptomeria japonica TaxID=3369 RepID=UPI0027D9E80F|nr:lysM domain receptor-like kinase 3 isoform X2 [Cryptomeria japonica]